MKNSIINLKAYRYILQILEGKSEFNNVKLSMENEGYVFWEMMGILKNLDKKYTHSPPYIK